MTHDSPHPANALTTAEAPEDALDTLGDPLTYTPEEYRWVPVRRQPRHDGWTEEKQRRFIEVLADSGQVGLAAKAVGMTRETAYRLRRSAQGAAFARAWDAARHHAGSLLEDVAFERAIEGVEQNVYDGNGEVVCTRRIYNDRLLRFLLTHLKPERYGGGHSARAAPVAAAPAPAPGEAVNAEPTVAAIGSVEACLRALEPPLPAPPETLLDAETMEDELILADVADGELPTFLCEQRPPKSPARLKREKIAAQEARGQAADARLKAGQKLTDAEFADLCHYLDPTYRTELAKKRCR